MTRTRTTSATMRALCGVLALILLASACSREATTDRPAAETTTTGEPLSTTSTAAEAVAMPPGDQVINVSHGGRDRSYRIHIPEGVVAPAPVMVALHGGGGTGEQFQTENGMDAVAAAEGFVVVYPEGTGVLPNRLHTWNSGFNCCGYALDNDIDDVGFLRAVVEDIDARFSINRGRIYATGHSNGAMMAYRFAAGAADLVVAIAPVGGAMSVAKPEPSQTVPMLHIHSVDDPRALYEGGEGTPFPGTNRTHIVEPTLPGINVWAGLNGCDPEPTVVETMTGTGDDAGQQAERLVWDCPDGAAVEHLRLAGSGHGWPGVTVGPIWQGLLGPPTTLVNASEEVWAFVSQFSR